MPSRSWQRRIEDILAAITDIQAWTLNKTQQDLETDRLLLRAVLYSFVIIGEASANLPDTVQGAYSAIP